jgi:hypothetical protein
MKTELFRLEVGVLLDENHPEFDIYNGVYTREHGFYDEDVTICFNYEEAKKHGDDYIRASVDKTYAVIIKDILNITEAERREIMSVHSFDRINDFSYAEKDMVYFAYKENEIIKTMIEREII